MPVLDIPLIIAEILVAHLRTRIQLLKELRKARCLALGDCGMIARSSTFQLWDTVKGLRTVPRP